MVKRATFLQMFLVAALFVIICAYGLAVAKDKLVLKYLPVDHDIETVAQNNTTNPLRVYQTNGTATDQIVSRHIGCLKCREFDQYCPDCCLYVGPGNHTLIHCQNLTDPQCQNPGPWPFAASCVNCTNTFKRTTSTCPNKSAKWPESYTPCITRGCPDSTRPWNVTKPCFEVGNDIWYCGENNLRVRTACASLNPYVESCQNFTNVTAYEKTAPAPAECIATGFAAGTCWKYDATKTDYSRCIMNSTTYAEQWEQAYYQYNNGTLGKKICPAGNCTSGFDQNCNVARCRDKIAFGCGNYTGANCTAYETDYREMLLGNIADTFLEIDPHFNYKFVARSGEQYMISWQVLCDVIEGDQRYNLYTMIKVWDQERQDPSVHKPVYQSIVHQKALGSTFYINAQTGMDAQKAPDIKSGHAYIIKLYYFLPNDGETPLQVDVSLMQMILYRTKN